MKLRHLPSRLVLATILTSAVLAPGMARAQGGGAPEQASAAALELFNSGNYKGSIESYEALLKNYPTSTVVPEAQFRLGYLHYLLGEYDASLPFFKKLLGPQTPPEFQELAASMIPQAMSAEALKQEDKARRKSGLDAAIKEFDAFLKKYPSSDQVESVTYGRGLACFQAERLDDAVASLRSNLQRFPRSESILDSQYLLALVLATQGSQTLQKEPTSADGAKKCDEAERLLKDIITKRTDIALLNDAQFQLGELFFNRGVLGPKERQAEYTQKAMEAYRAVLPKEPMVEAQKARIAGVRAHKIEALRAKDMPSVKRLQRLEENETGKLETVKGKGDLTIAAGIKIGQIYLQEKHDDEARVVLGHMKQFAEDDDQKKSILYFTTLTYASQNIRDKAVEGYDAFQAAYKADPMAENLPLVIGGMFLTGTPDPAKATEYFKQGEKLYPNSRFAADTLNAEANALLQLRRFDEALKSFNDFLATKPKPEAAGVAEFGIATIYKETGKIAEAIAAFKKVRDTYRDTPQAEQSAFWVASLTLQKGEIAGAIAELTNFVKNYPKSELIPTAKFTIAQAELSRNDKARALELFKEVGDQYPQSPPATYTYFQRAAILAGEQKVDDMIAVMKEFIAHYPNDDKVFFAYDSIGQNQIGTGKPLEAIATYGEMVEKRPEDPQSAAALLKLVQLWYDYGKGQGNYLALNEEQRVEWNKGIANSISAAEKLLSSFPKSTQVALALQSLLADQKLLLKANLKTDADVVQYFKTLAGKFEDKPDAKSKILFTLASLIYEKDKAKALEQMTAAYDPNLVYSSDDIDLYGSALLEAGKIEESAAVYKKLAGDYPNPQGVAPNKASAPVQDAQSVALYGQGKALQAQKKVAEAAAMFDQLKKLYPWSPKLLEASYGIAEGLHQQKKTDEAIGILVQIIRAPAATTELHAKAMMLLGTIQEGKGDIPAAIDQYIKIAVFYGSVSEIAAEGLWKGGQLLEKQAATLPDSPDPKKPKNPTKPGQLAKAVKAYEDLIAKYSDSPHVKEAGARLKALKPGGK